MAGTVTVAIIDDLHEGVIPAGRLNMGTAPTAADTVTIGGHIFKFVAALAAADVFTQIKRNATVATDRSLLVKAINGTADADIVAGTASTGYPVVADIVETSKIRVRLAATRGGTPFPETTSVAVAEGLTAAADVWDVADLNESGKASGQALTAGMGHVAITAAMITRGAFFMEFPFTPTDFMVWTRSGTGAALPLVVSDTYAISGNAVKITLSGAGAGAGLVAGDIVTILATI